MQFSGGVCCGWQAYNTQFGPEVLVESWNGTSWRVQPTKDATNSTLFAVSCAASDACTAVGDYENSSDHFATLAESWNGASWKIQPTPHPRSPSPANGSLYGVWCTSSVACTAVGGSSGGLSPGPTATLAEAWNGTAWKIQPTPSPADTAFGSLNGVSCTAARSCTAVGSYAGNTGVEATLAEAEGRN